MAKIRVLPVSQACQCPFYVCDAKGKFSCFMKRLTTLDSACMMVEGGGETYNEDAWDVDCKGSYDNCSILPLLYDCSEDETEVVEESPVVTAKTATVTKKVTYLGAEEDFDPFGTGDIADTEDEYIEVEEEDADKFDASEDDVIQSSVKVSAHVAKNPFIVKTDILVFPTNNMLIVDNLDLDNLSEGLIQDQCDAVKRPVKMGNVYVTGPGTSNVRAKEVYHAVVAGESQLINELDIAKSMRKALMMAEMSKFAIVEFLPMDRGMHDISQVAYIMVSSIAEFLKGHEVKHLTNIMLVSEDQETSDLFQGYLDRIIYKRQL